MNFQIVNPSPDKLDALVELCEAHAHFEQSQVNRLGLAARLRRDLFSDPPKLYCKMVEVEGQYIGYISWMKQYSTWNASEYIYMDCLYLDSNYRSRGIGAALMDELMQFAKSEDISEVQWQTPSFNSRAIKFYEKIGAIGKSKQRFILTI